MPPSMCFSSRALLDTDLCGRANGANDAAHATTIPWVSTAAVQWKRAPAATVWWKCAAAADARKFYGNATDDGATELSTIQSAAVWTGKWIHVTVRGEEW